MRNCLLRQDWFNLARLISMYTEMPLGKSRWYPTVLRVRFYCFTYHLTLLPSLFFTQFCLISLLHDPFARNTDLLDNFLEGVIGCQDKDEKLAFLNNIKDLPNNIHATKYDDLWKTEKETEENYLDKDTLKKFNNLLSKKLDLNTEQNTAKDGVDDLNGEDGWETMDESDESDDDNQVLDLNSILMQMESEYTETESIVSDKK